MIVHRSAYESCLAVFPFQARSRAASRLIAPICLSTYLFHSSGEKGVLCDMLRSGYPRPFMLAIAYIYNCPSTSNEAFLNLTCPAYRNRATGGNATLLTPVFLNTFRPWLSGSQPYWDRPSIVPVTARFGIQLPPLRREIRAWPVRSSQWLEGS